MWLSSTPRSIQILLPLIHLLIFIIFPVKCRLAQPGCLSYEEKTQIQSVSLKKIANISAGRPEWCEGPVALTKELRSRIAETSKPPFAIHSWNYEMSNALRVKVHRRSKNDLTNFIEEVIIQARPVLVGSNPPQLDLTRAVGRFYITPPDIQLGCCKLYDRNIARIYRNNTAKTKFVTFLWLPNGFKDDFEGPLVFVATITNTLSQYWTQVKSHIQVAKPRVDLTEDDVSADYDDHSSSSTTSAMP